MLVEARAQKRIGVVIFSCLPLDAGEEVRPASRSMPFAFATLVAIGKCGIDLENLRGPTTSMITAVGPSFHGLR